MISVQEGVTTEKTSPVKESRPDWIEDELEFKRQHLLFQRNFSVATSADNAWLIQMNKKQTSQRCQSMLPKPTPVKIPLHNCDFLVDKSSELTSLIDLLWVYGVKVKVGHFLYTSFEGKTIWKRTKQNDFSAYYSWGHFSYSAKEKGR